MAGENGSAAAATPYGPASEGPTVTGAAARELAADLGKDVPGFAQDMLDHVAEHLEPLRAETEVRMLTLATCAAHIEALLAMMHLGIPASRTETPVVALEHARRMAAHGLDVDHMLRVYRLGQAMFWDRLSARLIDRIEDRSELAAALKETAAVTFGYSDIVSSRVSIEHVTELERRQRQAIARRVDIVRELLAGEVIDVEAAERTLAHRLSGPQLAFLCWADNDGSGVDAAAQAVARALGAERPLMLPADQGAIAGWVVMRSTRASDAEAIRRAAAAAVPGVHVALGEIGHGVSGFRASRRQADSARRIARLTRTRVSTITRWSDVALVELLSRDVEAARELVAFELGPLAGRGEVAAKLREAMLAHLAAQGSHVGAAAMLGVHRNTALHRLNRAEELRGRPISERQVELHVALRLCAALGDAVIPA